MKPAPFKYIAAVSLEHALSLKAEYGDDAKFLAGGQSLIPTMNFRLARAGNPHRHQSDRRPRGYPAARRRRRMRRRADPLSYAGTRSRICGHVSIDRRGAAAHRASANPQPRHDRGKSRARRSGIRASGDRRRARGPIPHSGRQTGSAGSMRRIFSWPGLPPIFNPTKCWWRVELPLPKPRTGSCFMEVARRRGDFAIAASQPR